MTSKAFNKTVILIAAVLLVLTAAFMIVVDPYFHYHNALDGLQYPMQNEYYQNAGIAKNFEYEAMVAGDSETQNVSTSIVERLWGMTAVKVPNQGAPFVETDLTVKLALKSNPNLKLVIRPLDDYLLNRDPYLMRYSDEDLYLYDSNPFNDVRYVFEKETIIDAVTVLNYTRAGNTTVSFDYYSRTDITETYGNYELLEKIFEQKEDFGLSGNHEEIYANVKENVQQNVIATAKEYPAVEFLFFMPPYSACYWKELSDNGLTDVAVGIERAALEEILKTDNIRVFSFMDCYEITTDWSNYSDEIHFKGTVSDYIIEEMYKGNHEVTLDNLESYLTNLEDFYTSYDYSEMFEGVN